MKHLRESSLGWHLPPGHHHVSSSSGLSVNLGLFNSGASTLTTPVVSVGHAFAKGDVPSGSQVSIAGVSTLQQDRQAYWSDGSLRFAVLSFQSPDTITAGSTVTRVVSSVAGSPNNTPFITLSQLISGATINSVVFPATDFKLAFSGGDLGADTFHVQVSDINTNGTNFPWGSNPVQGWEVVRAGPVCCEWRFWGFLKRDSDSKFHKWLRAIIWVRVWNTGNYETCALLQQPNCYGVGANVNQTVGEATPVKHSFVCEMYNGSTLLNAWGGLNDSRVTTVSSVSSTNQTMTLPSGSWPIWGCADPAVSAGQYGVGCYVTSTGSLPTGVSGSPTIYYPAQAPGAAQGVVKLTTERWVAMRRNDSGMQNWAQSTGYAYALGSVETDVVAANNTLYAPNGSGTSSSTGTGPSGAGSSISDGTATVRNVSAVISSAGSGTIKLVPVATVFQQCGYVCLDQTGQEIWSGGGSKPTLLPVFDRTYLTRKALLYPWYDFTQTMYPLQGSATIYSGNLPVTATYLDTTGDGPNDDRIGYLGFTQSNALYNQTDPGWAQNVRALAAGFGEFLNHFIDERAGVPIVVNEGHDRAGGNYTNLAATNATYQWGTAGTGSPGSITRSTVMADQPGYDASPSDNSHMPSFWHLPYLRSGSDIWHELGQIQATGVTPNNTLRNQTINSTVYGCSMALSNTDQIRGCAWATKILAVYDHMMPNSLAIRPYIKDCNDDTAAGLAAWYKIQSAARQAIGCYGSIDAGNGKPTTESGYMLAMASIVFGLEAAKNERAGWLDFCQNYLQKSAVGYLDTSVGGSDYYCSNYWWDVLDGSSATLTSIPNFMTYNLGAGWSSPSTGLANGFYGSENISFVAAQGGAGNFPSDTATYTVLTMAGLAMLAAAGVTNAATVLGRINTRVTGVGGVVWSSAGSSIGYPTWNIVYP